MAGVKKIAPGRDGNDVHANLLRDLQMIVDDETDIGALDDRQNLFRHATDFIRRGILGAQLDQIAAAVTELLRDEFGRAAMQIGRVHESIKFAIRERFHKNNLSYLTGENRGNRERKQVSAAKIAKPFPTSSPLSLFAPVQNEIQRVLSNASRQNQSLRDAQAASGFCSDAISKRL